MERKLSRKERLERKTRVQKMKRICLAVVACFLCLVFLFWAGSSVKAVFMKSRLDKAIVREGVLEESTNVSALLVRNENVIAISSAVDNLQLCVEQGERVREGALIAEYSRGDLRQSVEKDYAVYAREAGLVSFAVDGLESVLTPHTILENDLSKLYETGHEKPPRTSLRNQFTVKIVDNLSPIYLCFPEKNYKLEEGGRVNLRFEFSPEIKRAEILRKSDDLVVSRLPQTPEELIGERLASVDIIHRREKGMIVPHSAVVTKDGKKGVYVIEDENVNWREIDIKGSFGREVVVNGVNVAQEIVSNPEILGKGEWLE